MFEASSSFNKFSQFDGQNPEQALNKAQCPICNEFKAQEELTTMGECNHLFCRECLKYYLSYRIKNEFALIECPTQGCQDGMDIKSEPFLALTPQLQTRYHKIRENLKIMKGKSQKICPDCEEKLLKNQKDTNLFCYKCLINYCPSCFGKAHPKKYSCEKMIIQFLKKNYLFKRCAKCLFVIQKKDGCVHMTCVCGYQFCYQCGGYWDNGHHICPPPKKFIKPLVVRDIRRQFPQRQALKPHIINLTYFNPQKLTKKNTSNLPTHLNYKNRQIKARKISGSEFEQNSFLINNKSFVHDR